jgi:aminoglycoside phosphotransferase family enzyme/predicted kinase
MAALENEVEAAFLDPRLYPHQVERLEVEETHISKVFLTGPFVYKVKKPVNLGFLDFGTLEKRRFFCERELLLNQRLSRGVYLEVVALTRDPEGYSLNGTGEHLEYAVKMRQLPREKTMQEFLHRDELEPKMVQELATVLADFYRAADRDEHIESFGSLEVVVSNVEENFSQTAPFVPDTLDQEKFDHLHLAVNTFINRHQELFQHRVDSGRIRDCHGDLRLDHVYFLDDLQIIDCIEFNDRFRYSDVAADLAFLAMDLDYHGCSRLGFSLIRSYAVANQDPEVFPLLDFYKCYRAHVRSKVDCIRLAEGGLAPRQHQLEEEKARNYFDLAYTYAESLRRPTLWIVCGVVASGKSTVARELSARLRVRVLSSDVIRKQLFGLEPEESAPAPYGEGIYAPAATDSTYERLCLAARQELALGNSAVLDATFAKQRYRQQVRQLSADLGATVIFVECRSPQTLIRQRLKERQNNKQISDARLEHLPDLLQTFEPLEELPEETYLAIHTDRQLMDNLVDLFAESYLLQGRQAGTSRRFPKEAKSFEISWQ